MLDARRVDAVQPISDEAVARLRQCGPVTQVSLLLTG